MISLYIYLLNFPLLFFFLDICEWALKAYLSIYLSLYMLSNDEFVGRGRFAFSDSREIGEIHNIACMDVWNMRYRLSNIHTYIHIYTHISHISSYTYTKCTNIQISCHISHITYHTLSYDVYI